MCGSFGSGETWVAHVEKEVEVGDFAAQVLTRSGRSRLSHIRAAVAEPSASTVGTEPLAGLEPIYNRIQAHRMTFPTRLMAFVAVAGVLRAMRKVPAVGIPASDGRTLDLRRWENG